MAEGEKLIRTDQQNVEKRSVGAVAGQFLSDAQHGAGWTAGALVVAGTVKKVTGVFPGNKPKGK